MAAYMGSPKAQAGTKRKLDGVIALDLFEVRLFECPLCLEVLRDEIFQCHRGHLICSTCEKKYSKCPTCQMSLSKKIRNIAMEELAMKIPLECPNGSLGCNSMCKAADIRAHLDNECAFEKKNFCAMIELECNELVTRTDWKKHLEKHGIETIQGPEAVIKQSVPPFHGTIEHVPTVKFKPVCLMAFNAAFVFKTQMNVRNELLTWELRSVGLQRPGDYYCKLTILPNPSVESQTLVNRKTYNFGVHKLMIFDITSEECDPVFSGLFFPIPGNRASSVYLEVKVKKWNDRVKSDAVPPPMVHSIPTTKAPVARGARTPIVNWSGKVENPKSY